MNYSDRVLIANNTNAGVAIYGRTINGTSKLGRFEVIADYQSNHGTIYSMYADAERVMKLIVDGYNNRHK